MSSPIFDANFSFKLTFHFISFIISRTSALKPALFMNTNKSISRFAKELSNYEILKNLDENDCQSYSNVFLCKKKGEQKMYVCKIVKSSTFNSLEFDVHILMKHNINFIKLHHFVFNNEEDILLIMDYVKDGDLFELVKKNDIKLDEATCKKLILTLVTALNDLHRKNIIHNDVKLENLLYDRKKKRLYVCDYGLSRITGTPSLYDGTTVYFSPEKIRHEPYQVSFDWWAVGVVSYEILSCEYPFDIDEENEEEMDNMEPEDMLPLYSKPLPPIKNISKKAMNFVKQMLELDINNRLSSYDEIIKHPFLKF
ncbi:pk-1 [Cryptophlebia leucotreta granulovirus]|uniref:non-specific serine/threonine protein kinase n=1 Tax=Cryptophlebia leucotreta granulosis virus TaxID=35254 RepID=Q7T5T3_GVCL|nr:pk-1 [Cryptophlebia leucotreta granulovirus]AAQ21601.1 pk-1 [Cryptophlebia leucotreta granulovirus]AUF82000.1 pk-1 [Cryptophlebia leucotreta granulovirus]